MTAEDRIEANEIALLIPCPFCHAGSGERCVTRVRRARAAYTHGARDWIVYRYRHQEWEDGWLDGLDNALRSPAYARETLARNGRTVPA